MKKILGFFINFVAFILFVSMLALTIFINLDTKSVMEKQALKYTEYIRDGKFKKAYNMLGDNDKQKYGDFEDAAKFIQAELEGVDSDDIIIVGSPQIVSDDLKSVYIKIIDKNGNVNYSKDVMFFNKNGKWKIQGDN